VVASDGADIADSLIANGCRIEGRVQRSILFPGVYVGPGAEVKDSVIMADTRIEAGAMIDRAILDKYVRVGERAVIGAEGASVAPADSEATELLDGLCLVGKDAWIPPGGRMERPSMVGVGGRYEDFADGLLRAGTIVRNRRWFEELR
jgi:glucose-1-phosphate adenylyltransferase